VELIWDSRIGAGLTQQAGLASRHGSQDPQRSTIVSVPSRRFCKACRRGTGRRPRAAARPTTDRCGTSFSPRSSALKTTVIASERGRPDVARRRAQGIEHPSRSAPERLVFIDATSTKTNMAPRQDAAGHGGLKIIVAEIDHCRSLARVLLLACRAVYQRWRLAAVRYLARKRRYRPFACERRSPAPRPRPGPKGLRLAASLPLS